MKTAHGAHIYKPFSRGMHVRRNAKRIISLQEDQGLEMSAWNASFVKKVDLTRVNNKGLLFARRTETRPRLVK